MQPFAMGTIAKSPFSPSKKTTDLILYISSKLKNNAHYDSTLFAKALFLIDYRNYIKNRKPITDFKYIKKEYGPIPDPAQFLSTRKLLVANGDLKKKKTSHLGRTQFKYFASREPDIEVFEKDEISLINDVLKNISNQNDPEIMDYRQSFAWIFTNDDEEIPYYSFLFASKKPEARDYEWAMNAIKKYEASVKNAP